MDYLIEFLIDSYSLMTCTAVCMDACTSMGLRVLPWPRYHATHPPWTLLNRVLGFFPPPISLSFSSSSHHSPARLGVTKDVHRRRRRDVSSRETHHRHAQLTPLARLQRFPGALRRRERPPCINRWKALVAFRCVHQNSHLFTAVAAGKAAHNCRKNRRERSSS